MVDARSIWLVDFTLLGRPCRVNGNSMGTLQNPGTWIQRTKRGKLDTDSDRVKIQAPLFAIVKIGEKTPISSPLYGFQGFKQGDRCLYFARSQSAKDF